MAHETKHWIDGSVKTKMNEFNAYMWQKAVDVDLQYNANDVWKILNTHPAYRHLID